MSLILSFNGFAVLEPFTAGRPPVFQKTIQAVPTTPTAVRLSQLQARESNQRVLPQSGKK